MSHLEIDQPQTCFNKSLNYEPQLELMPYIFHWARQLPPSPLGIIDLAAGYGIEAKELILNGFPCQAQDADQRMIDNALVQVFPGTAENLSKYLSKSFGGALLKDTLFALSPQQRIKMLEGLNNILTNNGSLLIISEVLSEYGINYTPAGVHSYSHKGKNAQDLQELYSLHQQLIQDNSTIELIGYKTTPENLQTLALNSGFQFQLVQSFPVHHPLVLESRWNKTSKSFIAQLTKTS